MSQVINTNIASLNAQRNLAASQGDANVALQRLSSGLRINSAKDDAAGLAISERFQSQITGLNMAQRNANDGISLAQTAEGAMDEITNNLQRIRELAVQSANATNSISDRQALNQEVQQRIEEINRIASQTSFNGLKVLDGTFATQTFQVGANTGETIAVSGLDSRGSQLGAIVSQTTGLGESVIGAGDAARTTFDISSFDFDGTTSIGGNININGVPLTITSTAYDSPTALASAVQAAIDDDEALAGITVSGRSDSLIFNNANNEDIDVRFALVDVDNTTTFTTPDLAPISASAATLFGNAAVSGIINVAEGGTIRFTVSGELAGELSPDDAPVEISIDTTDATSAADLSVLVRDALKDAGLSGLNVTVGGGSLNIAAATDDAVSISNIQFTGNNGGSLAGPGTLTAAEDLTLTESFAAGQTVDFEVEINGELFTFAGMTSLNDIVSQVNAQSSQTGIKANLNAQNDDIIFSSNFGEAFEIVVRADIDGDGLFDSTDDLTQTITATVEDNTQSVNQVDISTREGADLAMIAVDYAIDIINGFRAELGAVQNRFESTIANLATTSENLSASNSRIRDADFAAETAELARTQVLQQAGLSVLAQANARPQQVLQLLQG